jgi:hypothetical protein
MTAQLGLPYSWRWFKEFNVGWWEVTMTDDIVRLAQVVAAERPTFFEVRGPGAGNRETNAFMAELRSRVETNLGPDYAEQRICGNNGFAIDFYIQSEATIIEVALGLKNPNSEFERDILKAIMAQEQGYPVEQLVFVSKPGGTRRAHRAGAQAIISWLKENQNIVVDIHELVDDSNA